MPFLPTLLAVTTAAAPHIAAARTPKAPVMDGRLDEPAWRAAPVSSSFTQERPDEGKPSSEPTRVRVLYDDDAIYIGIECDQTRSPVVARLTRRDRDVEADWVSVSLDTRGDGKNAFEFKVNAAGVLYDGVYSNDTDFSRDWDEVWDAGAARTDRGWVAELRIPLHALRFEPKPVHSWGFQVRRYISARRELAEWSFAPRERAGEVSLYGRLDNLAGLRVKHYAEVLPYVAGKVTLTRPEPGADTEVDPSLSVGGDLRWHVTPQLTLNATVNPDFGQVEADPAILNLGTYEFFFPEKRPFFLEGADMFSMPLDLLYTRRIGRAPYSPEVLGNEEVVGDPLPATIYGAEKLVGDIGKGVSVGQLVAITGSQRVNAVTLDENGRPTGEPRPRVAEPLTTYKVFRVRSNITKAAQVGVTAMATNRYEPAGEYPLVPGEGGGPARQLCPGGELVKRGERCFNDAYVGSVDGRWQSPSGDYVVTGQLLGTLIENGPPRVYPDGSVLEPGDISPAGVIRVVKQGGGPWRFDLKYKGHGRTVDYNDLGFMPRQNHHEAELYVTYKTFEPFWKVQETATVLGVRDKETLDFLNVSRIAFFNSGWTLKNQWDLFAEIYAGAPIYDDREIGDGTALERSGRIGGAFFIGTDPRTAVRGEVFATANLGTTNGVYEVYAEAGVAFKILPQFDLSLAPTALDTGGEHRYFGTYGDSHLFGRLRARSLGLTLRSTYTFTPRLTLEAYAQGFLASGDYEDYLAFPEQSGGPGSKVHKEDLRPLSAAAPENPDYEVGTFNANVVLRWEFRAGSTLYVVYTHAQSDELIPLPGEPAGLSFGLVKPRVATDIFLVKLSYWWG
jgi:hypothetical protein